MTLDKMFIIITCLFTLAFSSEELVIDVTGLGRLRGSSGRLARNGQHYHQFLGVPFAEPPVGELRFREPVPVTSWDDIRDATVPGPSCIQGSYMPISGSEDCLTLNVFTKDPGARRPVLVYLHGGAFIHGGIAGKTGEYLLEEDIVLVTVQYRLGPLGWLTTADAEAPGNYGLQDQLLALRWVQKHIGAFGGDKAQVTIAGMSAGGASVNYLLLSPQTDGLFSRAFSMSGSAMAWWANIPHQERTAQRLGVRSFNSSSPQARCDAHASLDAGPGTAREQARRSFEAKARSNWPSSPRLPSSPSQHGNAQLLTMLLTQRASCSSWGITSHVSTSS